jgi:hypothetical protein
MTNNVLVTLHREAAAAEAEATVRTAAVDPTS